MKKTLSLITLFLLIKLESLEKNLKKVSCMEKYIYKKNLKIFDEHENYKKLLDCLKKESASKNSTIEQKYKNNKDYKSYIGGW